MTLRQSFFDDCNLSKTWNKVIEWQGLTLGTVHWHNGREWKLFTPRATWEEVKSDHYKPIAEFHTQQELWEYIRDNALTVAV